MAGSKIFKNIQSRLFQPVEQIVRKGSGFDDSLKSIWIVGAPRSGTTLTYQIFCTAFKAYYLTNRVAERYRIALLTRIFERFFYTKRLKPRSFDSNFGETASQNDPHEGGAFFYEFFPVEEPYIEKLNGQDANLLKRSVSGISRPFELFISKNTVHSLRIRALSEIFKNGVFIWVTRDKVDTAYSIIKAREKNGVNEHEWWSVRPPGWQEKKELNEIDMVLWQINEIERIIEQDLRDSKSIFLKIDYKHLCEDPKKAIKEAAKLLDLGHLLEHEHFALLPSSFKFSVAPENKLANEIRTRSEEWP